MGEIGYDSDKFLNDLCLWQIHAIIRGYRKRTRDMLIMQRWHAWVIINSIRTEPIETPEQLLTFSFEKKKINPLQAQKDAEDLEKLIEDCKAYNKSVKEKEG